MLRDEFESSLNQADRSSVYLNFHPTLTQDYDAIKAASFWDMNFPYDEGLYSISVSLILDPNNVSGTISGSGTYAGGVDISFVMAQNGSNWMIREMYTAGTTVKGDCGLQYVAPE